MKAQLNLSQWLIEEENKTRNAVEHIRKIIGIYEAENDTTVALLEGYRIALARVAHREDH